MEVPSIQSSNAVYRTITILEQLAKHRKIHLERLSAETHIPKPTLLRFLSSLIESGYVHRDTNDQYSLTLRMFSIGSKGLSHMDISQEAYPIAVALGEKLHETVHMGVLDDKMATYILKIESQYTLRMYSRVGKRIPLYCTAIGKILLSSMKETQLESFFESTERIPYTPYTISERASLEKELSRIKSCGYAEDYQEHEEGIQCIAAPVKDYSGEIIAGLSVSWPIFRFKAEKRDEYIRAICSSAHTLSTILGYVSH